MKIPPLDPSPLTAQIADKWAQLLDTKPTADQFAKMHLHIDQTLYAISNGLRIKPPAGIPEIPFNLAQGLEQTVRGLKTMTQRLHEQQTGIRTTPLWKQIAHVNYEDLGRDLRQIARDAKQTGPLADLARRGEILFGPKRNIAFSHAGIAFLLTLCIYTWKTLPDPSDLTELALEEGDLYDPLIIERFEEESLFYVGGAHRYRHYDWVDFAAHSGKYGLLARSWGETDDDVSDIYFRWIFPRPIFDHITLLFYFRPSDMPRDTNLGVYLTLPTPDRTIVASTLLGWFGTPGWWYTFVGSLADFTPHSFLLKGKIRRWGTCRLDIDLNAAAYTRIFMHSADMISYPLPTEYFPKNPATPGSLSISWSSKTSDEATLHLDDILLINHGNLLPGYSLFDMLEPYRRLNQILERQRLPLFPETRGR